MEKTFTAFEPSANDLIATKLEMPPLAPRVVNRGRLTSVLQGGLPARVSLIVAPAGYGKTTLLAEWIIKGLPAGWHLAWVSLDKDDNNIGVFWSYFLGALQKVLPEVDRTMKHLFRSEMLLNEQIFLKYLINQIAASEKSICLVLDDFHTITEPAVLQSMAYFINHQPKNFHLVIASRSMPAMPLSRLRAQGQLVEVLADELSFTPAEVKVFLHNVMELDLGYELVEMLTRASEGWIAGLKLAAISMRTKKSSRDFSLDKTTLNQQIFDFLVEEALQSQDEAIKEFLLKSSLFAEFSAAMCNDLFERTDSRQIISQLLQNQLFIIPLDTAQTWYRYHPLFSQTLRILSREADPEGSTRLLRQACCWMQTNGYSSKAVTYALDSGDFECAAEIIESCALAAVTHFNLTDLVQWVNRLSPDMLEARPQLGIYVALAHFLMGQADKVEARLRQIELELEKKSSSIQPGFDQDFIHWQIAALRAVLACLSEANEHTIGQLIRLRANPPPNDVYFVGSMTHILADAYVQTGQLENALVEYQRGMDFALQHNLTYEVAYSLTGHANVLKRQGRLTLLEQDYLYLLQYAGQANLGPIFNAYAVSGLLEVAVDRNELAAADNRASELTQLLAQVERAPGTWIRPEFLFLRLCHYWLYGKNLVHARQYFDLAYDGFMNRRLTELFLNVDLMDLQVRLWEQSDPVEKASFDLLNRLALLNFDQKATLVEKSSLARYYLAKNKPAICRQILDGIYNTVAMWGLNLRQVELLILYARSEQSGGEPDKAAAFLYQALQLAEPENFQRPFLEDGESLGSLLRSTLNWANQSQPEDSPVITGFIQRLLVGLDELQKRIQQILPGSSPVTIQLEPKGKPLSSREEEVLGLLAKDLSTKEIAAALNISLNTAKSHLRQIYQKLGINSRAEAVKVLQVSGEDYPHAPRG